MILGQLTEQLVDMLLQSHRGILLVKHRYDFHHQLLQRDIFAHAVIADQILNPLSSGFLLGRVRLIGLKVNRADVDNVLGERLEFSSVNFSECLQQFENFLVAFAESVAFADGQRAREKPEDIDLLIAPKQEKL